MRSLSMSSSHTGCVGRVVSSGVEEVLFWHPSDDKRHHLSDKQTNSQDRLNSFRYCKKNSSPSAHIVVCGNSFLEFRNFVQIHTQVNRFVKSVLLHDYTA